MNNKERIIRQLSLDIEYERLKQEIIDKEKRGKLTADESKQNMAELTEYYKRMTEQYQTERLIAEAEKLCLQLINNESRP